MRSVLRYLWCSLTRRRDLVHQKFTSGALIEKRARGKIAEVWRKWLKVRDGKSLGKMRNRPVLFVAVRPITNPQPEKLLYHDPRTTGS